MKKVLCLFLIICLMSCVFAGCNNADDGTPPAGPGNPTEPTTKQFTKNNLTIELPGNFTDQSQFAYAKNYTFLYAGPHTGVQGIEYAKSSLPETVKDLKGFARYHAEEKGVQAEQKGNLWTMTYVDEVTDPDPERYVCGFYEGSESYWIVRAYCREDVYETYEADLWAYIAAATVK